MRHVLLSAVGISALALGSLAGTAHAQASRPFDDYTPPSSVSPYLNLVNNNNGTSNNNSSANLFLNYQLMVKPQLEQRQFNRQSTAAIRQMQYQQQHASLVKSSGNTDSGKKLRATGHAATRVNYSHFYPTMNREAPR
ncbi:MAG TPA: hypothetical protein VGG64_20740 [Pirellulales bacterium]